MKYYFLLQLQLFNRRLSDFGIHPIVGYVFVLILFLAISFQIFSKLAFSSYLYALLALGLCTQLSSKERNDFLKLTFSIKDYRLLRLYENILIVFPFSIFLAYKAFFLIACALLIIAGFVSQFQIKKTESFIVPTPFQYSFEFITGFRNAFLILLSIYIAFGFSLLTHNPTIGLVVLLALVAVILNFYMKPENEYYVWSFALTPSQFLRKKSIEALSNTFILTFPIFLTLIIWDSESIIGLTAFYGISFLFLITVVFAKYASFPNELGLPKALMIGLCIYFPPIIILLTILFYIQAQRKLKSYLQ